MSALLASARALASSSGNGATVTVVPTGSQTVVTLYAGRPNGGAFGPIVTTDTLDAAIASAAMSTATFSLFIDSAGTGTASAWTTTQGVLNAEPPCPGALDLTFSAGSGRQTHALACTDMVLQ